MEQGISTTAGQSVEVRGEFQCTFEDYYESLTLTPPPLGPGSRGSMSWSARGWILVMVFGLVLFGVVTKQPKAGVPVAAAPRAESEGAAVVRSSSAALAPVGRFAIAMLPMILISIAAFLFNVGNSRKPVAQPWRRGLAPNPSKFTRAAGLVMVAGMLIAIFGLATWRSSPGDTIAFKPSTIEWTLGVAPMVLAIGVALGLSRFSRKAQLRAQWEAQPALHRVHQIEANERGISVIEPLSRHTYSWDSLTGYRETPSLLLLYISAYAHWMIPKRAFGDPLNVDRFKGLIMTYMESGYFLDTPAGAFQVKAFLTEPADIPFAQVSPAAPPSKDEELTR